MTYPTTFLDLNNIMDNPLYFHQLHHQSQSQVQSQVVQEITDFQLLATLEVDDEEAKKTLHNQFSLLVQATTSSSEAPSVKLRKKCSIRRLLSSGRKQSKKAYDFESESEGFSEKSESVLRCKSLGFDDSSADISEAKKSVFKALSFGGSERHERSRSFGSTASWTNPPKAVSHKRRSGPDWTPVCVSRQQRVVTGE
jgi:hypothetical protein